MPNDPKLAWVNPYWAEFLMARVRAIIAMRTCGNTWEEIADQLGLNAEQAKHIYESSDGWFATLFAPKDN